MEEKKFECEHEHVVRAVTRNTAGHIAWSNNFIDSKSNSFTIKIVDTPH